MKLILVIIALSILSSCSSQRLSKEEQDQRRKDVIQARLDARSRN